jgi:hypothetical protein
MTRRVRIIFGVLILAISIYLLIWGLAPARRETRIQNISPSEMELPTQSSYRFDVTPPLSASHFDDVHRFALDPRLAL